MGMTTIRNGTSHNKPKYYRGWGDQMILSQLLLLFLVATMAFYGGVLLGMQLMKSSSCTGITAESSTTFTKSLRADSNNYVPDGKDFHELMQATVERRSSSNDVKQKHSREKRAFEDSDSNTRPRRFPETTSKFAIGATLIGKNDFLATFDYGIPKPPSKRDHESDPGKDDVILLYGSTNALPDTDTGVVYLDESEDGTSITASPPHMSAQDATKNCGALNVIFTDSQKNIQQCTAIVANYESYHIQRWMRIDPRGSHPLDNSLPLSHVGRGMQDNGSDKFSAPNDRSALQNQALLETYFSRLEDTISKLDPMAKECAGSDNTVIVMVCNTGQSELLINFFCSAEARGFGDVVREKVLVFATDEGVLEIAQRFGVKSFYDEEIFKTMPTTEARVYGDRAFTQMMYAKVVTVQLVNRMGFDVLFQDVDLVWYQNPLPYFHDKNNPYFGFDILFQDDGARTTRYAPYSANTGFYYVRNNAKTKFLFRSLLYLGDMVLSMNSHQQALGALLDEHASLTGLRVKTLPAITFPGGYHFHRKKEVCVMMDIVLQKRMPYILHMSWTTNKSNKLLFFQQMGLWYTKEECKDGGGASIAKRLNSMNSVEGLEEACCLTEPFIACHYSDKPSVQNCKDASAPSIDKGGKAFWSYHCSEEN